MEQEDDEDTCSSSLADLVRSDEFQGFVVLVILLDLVLFVVKPPVLDASIGSTPTFEWQDYVEMGIVGVFIVEQVMKVLAFGTRYFLDWLNVIDFTIVVSSTIALLLIKRPSSIEAIRGIVKFLAYAYRGVRLFRIAYKSGLEGSVYVSLSTLIDLDLVAFEGERCTRLLFATFPPLFPPRLVSNAPTHLPPSPHASLSQLGHHNEVLNTKHVHYVPAKRLILLLKKMSQGKVLTRMEIKEIDALIHTVAQNKLFQPKFQYENIDENQ